MIADYTKETVLTWSELTVFGAEVESLLFLANSISALKLSRALYHFLNIENLNVVSSPPDPWVSWWRYMPGTSSAWTLALRSTFSANCNAERFPEMIVKDCSSFSSQES